MSKRTGLILFLALAALFLIVNHAAYKGYFTDDDFDHLTWTRHASMRDFLSGLLTPKYQTNNFRPLGHLFYHEESQFFGFDFPKYLAASHILHFLNVWLLWLLARRSLSLPPPLVLSSPFTWGTSRRSGSRPIFSISSAPRVACSAC
jgi:hypothetical protein